MESDTRAPATDYDRRNVTGTGPYQVEVAAGLRDVRLPHLCARCAGVPTGTLAVDKMFRRTHDDAPDHTIFARLVVPVCQACLDLHAAERQPMDPAVLRTLRNRFILRTLPYWIPLGVILYMLGEFASPLGRAVASGEPADMLIWGAVVGVFGLLLLMFVRLVLAARRDLIADWHGDPNDQYVTHERGPLGIRCVVPGPPTGTSGAVNFADEDFELFARNRRTFTFTNLDVATAFAAENADLVWDPSSPVAVRARWGRNVVVGGIVLVAVALWLKELLGF